MIKQRRQTFIKICNVAVLYTFNGKIKIRGSRLRYAQESQRVKSTLKQAGFTYKPAKGSHSKWTHPKLSTSVIIAGKDGDDAKSYLEKQVNEALEELNKIEQEEQEKKEE